MKSRSLSVRWWWIAGLMALQGCDNASGPSSPSSAAPEPGYFTGLVTRADGSAIALPGVTYQISINGVTAVGENNNFRPPVAADGTFSLQLPPGQFYPPLGTLTVPFEGKKYVVDLDPVPLVEGQRDSGPGIVQNFHWRLSGPKPQVTNPDVNNATHWYGITVPVGFRAYREDTQQSVQPLPDGSKLTWRLQPTSTLLDGSAATPLTVERKWTALNSWMDALNDLPAANYEISAVATLPDGSTKAVLVEEFEERKYKPSMHLVLKPDPQGDRVFFLPASISWVVE